MIFNKNSLEKKVFRCLIMLFLRKRIFANIYTLNLHNLRIV
jgi:hypothetical protein